MSRSAPQTGSPRRRSSDVSSATSRENSTSCSPARVLPARHPGFVPSNRSTWRSIGASTPSSSRSEHTRKPSSADRKRWRAWIELANATFGYLEIFHNRQRRHSALGMRTRARYGTPLPEHPPTDMQVQQAVSGNAGQHQVELVDSATGSGDAVATACWMLSSDVPTTSVNQYVGRQSP